MNSLGNNRELAENKLILLYLIQKIDMPVTNLQVTKLVLENKLMNYFLLQQYLNELCEGRFLSCGAAEDKTVYNITGHGRQTLDYFIGLIPQGIKSRIDETISSIRRNLKNETLITADFTPESENKFTVNCGIREDNFSLIDLNIAVGTRNDARLICENWKKHPQAIYSEIIEILTKKRD